MKLEVKKILGLFLFTFLFLAQPVSAQNIPVNAYFFYGDGCPHCAEERQYLLHTLKNEYPNLQVYEYEIYNSRENAVLLQRTAEKLSVGVDGVPFLVIGDKHFVGYANGISSQMIEQKVNECSTEGCPDSVSAIVGIEVPEVKQPAPVINKPNNNVEQTADNKPELQNTQEPINQENKKIVKLPLFGEVNALSFSLPILTIIMGALDGFNPCAMWTLLFLISLLLGMENRKRMWILGTAFIVASASVYFLFMSAWLNLILFLGFVIWIRMLVGILALAGGGYSLKEFIFNKDSGCKVAGDEKRQKTFARLKLAVQQNSLWLALGGIVVLAFAVNLVELICSAGLPAVYTQVLALNEMAGWQYYSYILLYIFFFMLDDLFIFFVAMITLEMTGITTKYAKVSRLIGGLVMLTIGLMLIFKPEWLMFG
jgi:glutaredoxin